MKTCSVDGCNKPLDSHGFCNSHAKRFRRHGSPTGGRVGSGEVMRFVRGLQLGTDQCIKWPFSKAQGYGQLTVKGRHYRANRFVCEFFHGADPGGLEAAHSCGNAACVNPAHLRWATPTENAADRDKHGTTPIGETHGRSKITASQAEAVWALLREGIGAREAAKLSGTSVNTARDIKAGRSWRTITRLPKPSYRFSGGRYGECG